MTIGTRMIGNLMIAAGVALIASGAAVLVLAGRNSETQSRGLTEPQSNGSAERPPDAESTREQNLKKGGEFENWVVSKFDSRYFKVLEWRGDKASHGHYAESSRSPDLEMDFALKEQTMRFAVECKWRKSFYRDGIEWSYPGQIDSYRSFASTRKMPVFVVLGVGGTPGDPNEVFVVPLPELKSPFVPRAFLMGFRRNNANRNFYLDVHRGSLR